jgi:hypothetical protein
MAEGWTLLPLIHISENHIANHLDGQICPVLTVGWSEMPGLELDGQNQTRAIVGWLKRDFTPKVTAQKILILLHISRGSVCKENKKLGTNFIKYVKNTQIHFQESKLVVRPRQQ